MIPVGVMLEIADEGASKPTPSVYGPLGQLMSGAINKLVICCGVETFCQDSRQFRGIGW